MAFEIGQSVGNYRILRRLGAGGMGEVFLAEHPLIGKSVALKVIHQDLSVNQEVASRFVNEAKAVSSVGNEHIVNVHDFGTTPDGAHFFIMEYLEGRTLAEILPEGTLAVARALHIGAQIAAGLEAAHNEGIVHRDLKPDNIMLVEKLGDPNFVKILDFGLAKMLEAEKQLTAMGVVLGTPEYMSPEAAESKMVDGRSDVYSLGVLLFQMLTGRLPFIADTMGKLMVQHVCRAPPVPRGINAQIPPSVDQIILRCLAKLPEERFQSMGELRRALLNPEQYLGSSPPVVASEGRAAQHPAIQQPTSSENRTMTIGVPPGHRNPNRSRQLILVAVALLSAGTGAAVAVAQEPFKDGAALELSPKDISDVTSLEPKQALPEPKNAPQATPKLQAAPREQPALQSGESPKPDPKTKTPLLADSAGDAGTPAAAAPESAIPEVLPVTEKAKVPRAVKKRPRRPKAPPKPKKPKKPKKNVGENTMAPSF